MSVSLSSVMATVDICVSLSSVVASVDPTVIPRHAMMAREITLAMEILRASLYASILTKATHQQWIN